MKIYVDTYSDQGHTIMLHWEVLAFVRQLYLKKIFDNIAFFPSRSNNKRGISVEVIVCLWAKCQSNKCFS